jgi:hypothetical protein
MCSCFTYQDTSVRKLSGKEAGLRTQIWTNYVQRMITRKGNEKRYPSHVTTTWLKWLAQEMRSRNKTVFFLEELQPDWLSHRQTILYRLSAGFLFGLGMVLFAELVWMLVFWLPFWFSTGVAGHPLVGLVGTLPMVLSEAVFCGLFFSLRPIQLSETHTWSWAELWPRLLFTLSFGMGGGAVLLFSKRHMTKISGEQLTERVSHSPNDGLRRSAKNGIRGGLLLIPFAGICNGLFALLLAETRFGIGRGLTFGLLEVIFSGGTLGAALGLVLGLGAFFQHYILRFWLGCHGIFPWRAIPFLEDATARMLLRRVGGGYSFTHRLLLDYFADLDIKMPSVSRARQ